MSKALSKLDKSIKIFGDKEYRCKNPPKEDAEQKTIFNVLRRDHPDLAELATHIKNEGNKSQGEAKKDRLMGLLAGFSDIVIIGNPVFLCELKKTDITKSKISDDQESFLINAQKAGAFVCVALGHKGFFDALEAWKECTKMIKNG